MQQKFDKFGVCSIIHSLEISSYDTWNWNSATIDCFFPSQHNLQAEREKNDEELGLLHIAKDQAEADLEKVKAELEVARKAGKETEEKSMKKNEARMKWEVKVKRATERYKTSDGWSYQCCYKKYNVGGFSKRWKVRNPLHMRQ